VPGQLRGTGAVHAVHYFVVVWPKAFDFYRQQLQPRPEHCRVASGGWRVGTAPRRDVRDADADGDATALVLSHVYRLQILRTVRSHSTAFPVFDLNHPCPDDVLKIWPVDAAVGNVKNNGPELALPFVSS
jgi:hypothetical protein